MTRVLAIVGGTYRRRSQALSLNKNNRGNFMKRK